MTDWLRTTFAVLGAYGCIINLLATLQFAPVADNCDRIPFCFATIETSE